MIVNPVKLPPGLGDPQWTSGQPQPVVMPRRQSVAEAVELIASARRDRDALAAQVATLREHLESSRAMVAQLRARLEVRQRGRAVVERV